MAWQAVIGTFVRMFTARPQGQGTGVTEFAVFFLFILRTQDCHLGLLTGFESPVIRRLI